MEVLRDALTSREVGMSATQKVREWREGPEIGFLTSCAMFRMLERQQVHLEQNSRLLEEQRSR